MLFYKRWYPLSWMYHRGSGRAQGRITCWSRKSLTYRTGINSYFACGLFLVYRFVLRGARQSLTAYAIDQAGCISSLVAVYGMPPHVIWGLDSDIYSVGSRLPLKWISSGVRCCWVDRFSRSAGTSLQILRHKHGLTQCKLPSRKVIWLASTCLASVGRNAHHIVKHVRYEKAGHSHWRGIRSHVRGVAMNPIDHPHGGGQGKTSGGRPGVTPWGVLTKGYRSNRRKLKPKTHALRLET